MTASTEQERAQFEEWAKTVGLNLALAGHGLYAHVEAQAAWMAWTQQAARRAPAAPVPQGLREAAQAVVERWDTPLWKDVPATTVYIADLRAALAAAPQPPVPQVTPEMIEAAEEAYMPFGDMGLAIQCALSAAPQPPESAQVQLPEPVGVAFTFEAEEGGPVSSQITSNPSLMPMGWTRIFTEQQVRQLLAAHGIQEQST